MANYDVMIYSALSGGITGYNNFQFDGSSLSITGDAYIKNQKIVDASWWATTDVTSSPYSVSESIYVILCDCSSNPITVTLQNSSDCKHPITVKKVDASNNAVTVNANDGAEIDGQMNYSLDSQYQSITVISTGSKYNVISKC